MRRRPVIVNPPLEERVDRAGIRQREDPRGARASRDMARRGDEEGWWWHDGNGTWTYHGTGD